MIFHLNLMLFLMTMKKSHSWFLDESLFFIYVYNVYFENYLMCQLNLSRRVRLPEGKSLEILFERLRMRVKKLSQLMHRIFFRNEFISLLCEIDDNFSTFRDFVSFYALNTPFLFALFQNLAHDLFFVFFIAWK